MGDTARCPDNIGPATHIVLGFADYSEVHLCNFGIFSCSCSNIEVDASANDPIAVGLQINSIEAVDDEYVV